MNDLYTFFRLTSLAVLLVSLVACGGSDDDSSPTPEVSPTPTPEISPTPTPETSPTPEASPTPETSPTPTPEASPTPTPVASGESVNPDYFLVDGLAEDITTVECTLSGGTETMCYQVVIAGVPADADVGPFCPSTITSDASEGGIWFDGSGELYDVDGDFIVDLAAIYDDANWLLYDESGNVNVTDTQESCEGAARPDVEEIYQNHCVQCDLSYVNGGVSVTYLLPVNPVPLDSSDSLGNGDLGVTLNGGTLAAAAPVDAILSAYTIAAFDDCGGHINTAAGYHYHAATGCTDTLDQSDGHAPLIGYIQDGYGLYAMADEDGSEPNDLDECRGHTDESRGYHYHAASPEENMFIGCYHGEQTTVNAGGPGGPGGPPQ